MRVMVLVKATKNSEAGILPGDPRAPAGLDGLFERMGKFNDELVKAEIYDRYLIAAEEAMEQLHKRRDNEIYPRWRANYDLILAQLIAYKIHVYEYGAYLEEFKKNPKKVPLTKPGGIRLAQWDVRHRQETIAGEKTRSHIERARAMQPELTIIARAHSDADVDHLVAAGADVVIMGEHEVARGMIAHVFPV